MPGLFITLEGADGAGKTTQGALLAQAFRALQYPVLETREPGGTPVGEAARRVLLDPSLTGMAPMAEVFLYAAARAQLIREVILPALAAGTVVICDRFTDSTLAYQGYGRGLDMDRLQSINHWATEGLAPDLTLLLDIDSDEGLSRARRKGADRMEMETAAFHQKVRHGFLELAAKETSRIRVIPAGRDIFEVHRQVINAVREKVPELVCSQEG
ncbi:dTMP kinase [Heliobacillus mobilis]|uniref:Thymidylate kinase n=2 Tax=Heliobacterium mobile TaxID=28064 RepID=A0A6I3SHS2_HELMO|nr:dTMP kinase [Heliobacterium mobile]MTV48433.1 dTMP kinase [Heliobacterium mobile]